MHIKNVPLSFASGS